jgi:hypothetical protein
MRKVHFWLKPGDHALYVEDVAMGQVIRVERVMDIIIFLNAHRLTADQLTGVHEGKDVFAWFAPARQTRDG